MRQILVSARAKFLFLERSLDKGRLIMIFPLSAAGILLILSCLERAFGTAQVLLFRRHPMPREDLCAGQTVMSAIFCGVLKMAALESRIFLVRRNSLTQAKARTCYRLC